MYSSLRGICCCFAFICASNELFNPLSLHTHSNRSRLNVAMTVSQGPQQCMVTDFQSSSKESSFHLCLVKGAKRKGKKKRTLGPSENSASSLTLGITKVLFFQSSIIPSRGGSADIVQERWETSELIFPFSTFSSPGSSFEDGTMVTYITWVIASGGQLLMNPIDKFFLLVYAGKK